MLLIPENLYHICHNAKGVLSQIWAIQLYKQHSPSCRPFESQKRSKSWAISGGLGSLGLLSASWLLANNAATVYLMGRSGRMPASEAQEVCQLSNLFKEASITAMRYSNLSSSLLQHAPCMQKGTNFEGQYMSSTSAARNQHADAIGQGRARVPCTIVSAFVAYRPCTSFCHAFQNPRRAS